MRLRLLRKVIPGRICLGFFAFEDIINLYGQRKDINNRGRERYSQDA